MASLLEVHARHSTAVPNGMIGVAFGAYCRMVESVDFPNDIMRSAIGPAAMFV